MVVVLPWLGEEPQAARVSAARDEATTAKSEAFNERIAGSFR
jgi:hypothetical protein